MVLEGAKFEYQTTSEYPATSYFVFQAATSTLAVQDFHHPGYNLTHNSNPKMMSFDERQDILKVDTLLLSEQTQPSLTFLVKSPTHN